MLPPNTHLSKQVFRTRQKTEETPIHGMRVSRILNPAQLEHLLATATASYLETNIDAH